MKKAILYALLIVVFWVIFYSYKQFKTVETQNKKSIQVSILNFQKVYDYLQKNYKWNYPLPSWDLILLDKHNSLIHLEDRKTPLDKIKNLAVIQWTTCNILKNDKNFQNINYDKRFSIIDENWNIAYKRCFTYAITKDRKHFQIWTIINENWKYKTLLLWNIKKSITKSYNSPILAKDGSEDFIPYYPWKISPIVVLKNKWNSLVKVKVNSDDKNYTIDLKEWNNVILSWITSTCDIEIIWNLSDNSILKFIDTNGSIVYIRPNENSSKVDFKIKDYSINTKNINYFVETWRFLANIVKLWDDKDMEVKKGDVTLVIRWTRFTINAWKDTFDTFLSLWHIVQNVAWKNVNLTLQNAFSVVKDSKLVEDVKEIKKVVNKLVGFTVFNDILTSPSHKITVSSLWWNVTDLTWAYSLKRYKVSYGNWQDIWLVVFDNSSEFKDFVKENKELLWIKWNIRHDVQYYANIVNQICGSSNLWVWLDVTKLHYTLDNKSNTLNWFNLKDAIKSKLWLTENNYILFTSRKYNWQDSSRLAYNSKTNTIDSYSFAMLSTTNMIKKAIFACDVK